MTLKIQSRMVDLKEVSVVLQVGETLQHVHMKEEQAQILCFLGDKGDELVYLSLANGLCYKAGTYSFAKSFVHRSREQP